MTTAERRRSSTWSYLLIAAISFASGEIALRIYNHFQPSFVFYNASYNRYRGNPFESWFGFHMNSKGFMDTEFGAKHAGTYRIVAIGDSFAHGVVPYPNNFLTLAETEIGRARPSVEIYNLGIPRIGPRDYLSVLVNEGLSYDPDEILVCFFVGNDFRDAVHDEAQRRPYEYSYVLSLLRHAFYIAPRSKGVAFEFARDRYRDSADSIDDEGYRKAKLQAAELFRKSPSELRDVVATSVGYLRQMEHMAESRHAKFAVVVFPDELQLYEPLRQRFMGDARRDDGTPLDMSLPSQMLDDALEAEGIPHLDLRPSMLDAARTTSLYKPNDTHWNIAGNALAAREVAAFLQTTM